MAGWRFWPRSLATRTALVLLTGLMAVQIAGLTIHAFDRIDVQQIAQERDIAGQIYNLSRTIGATARDQRPVVLAALHGRPDMIMELSPAPPVTDLPPIPPPALRRYLMESEANLPSPNGFEPDGLPRRRATDLSRFIRPHVVAYGGLRWRQLVIGVQLPDGEWLNLSAKLQPARAWHSPTFMGAFGLMTVVAAGLTLWAVRRLTAPVRTLAAAAEALGRDVNAPPLPETGPLEVAMAGAAFNTMASRIRRFVDDRTALLTAIGHDLRTPITRLKLRAEFMDDDEARAKMLTDLEELEAMVASTLAFGRDARTTEQVVSLDIAELLRTILDEAGDAHPGAVDKLTYDGPSHLPVRVRSLAMKRALTNLVSNAIAYGGSAHVRLHPPAGGVMSVTIEDEGPGIPTEELERVFEPFRRIETSRNRETGGTGLGLPIARDILRAHGGDVVLSNRPHGGLTARVTIPV